MIRKEENEEKGDDGGKRESLRRKLEKKRKSLRRAPHDRWRRAVREGRDLDLGGAATPEFRDSESG